MRGNMNLEKYNVLIGNSRGLGGVIHVNYTTLRIFFDQRVYPNYERSVFNYIIKI
jgi:hypothetical protein